MAMDMFIRIGTLQGESRDKVHGAAGKQKIDVLAWSWGMSNSGTAHTGGGAGGGKANIQDLSITKYIDRCSPSLMLACCKGTHYDDAELIVRKAGDTPIEYVKITLTEVLVTAVSTGGSGGEDRLTENVTLNFSKVKVEYTEQTAKGGEKAGPSMIFNIAENVSE